MATNFGLKSSRNTVKAKQVSVKAYQNRSIRCSNSAALNVPKNILKPIKQSFVTKKKNVMTKIILQINVAYLFCQFSKH